MTRLFKERRLLVASHNAGKVREIADLLRPFAVTLSSSASLGLTEPEETEDTFIGNAKLKALAAAHAAHIPALADDSGLCIDTLAGAPGVYSARWAGPDRDFNLAMDRVKAELSARGQVTSRAHFVCALALAWPDGHCEVFEGRASGTIVFPKRGANGFGYDPIFVPDGYELTFGEMEPQLKHAISHRAAAFAALVEACFEDLG